MCAVDLRPPEMRFGVGYKFYMSSCNSGVRERICLAVCLFPGSHTSKDYAAWMRELWLNFGLEEVQLVEVFIAGTADGAGKELNAFAEELEIACKVCLGHRLNTTVQWASGIAGSPPSARTPEGTILNPDMRKLISRCAGLETKAMVNSDTFELPTSQSLELNSEGTIVNDVDVEFEEVSFEDLPPIAQTLVFVLRSKYEAYDLGDPVSREDRICCALHPTFPWIDEEVKAQAFEERRWRRHILVLLSLWLLVPILPEILPGALSKKR
ncbi:hypothetical protein CYMTET_42264 [Cymbomonas tetramitiformis]|uniref:Uncharacterized protein n=1 Tax=Cymbomonas tetramitiformis TaxID=36881 RepID=A0AAE0C6E6_9CHLO|nr:hypothetical protein CYMTET_42264 [Cymbomonas tetramitiformis]